MIIDNKYEIGQTVYLVTDCDQLERFVISIIVHPNNLLMYKLACAADETTEHFEFEIADEKSYS
jgi:hypothetical protein